MLKVRIIPCLDVKDGRVVKGVQFRDQLDVGDILDLAKRYSDEGADELVFYDISASSENRSLDRKWIERIASVIQIPFCVAGGIRSIKDGEEVLSAGADKISVNSPALEDPDLIDQLSKRFGNQCVVVSIDSFEQDGSYYVYQYTGDPNKSRNTLRKTTDWAKEARDRGAGEIVLNCMNQDGMRKGYDISQLTRILEDLNIPVIASGGAGSINDFYDLFYQTKVTGALAASVFHRGIVDLRELKESLKSSGIEVRL
jgi:cyclase